MKCPSCQADNKDGSKSCRKCGMNLQLPPLWQPTWAWHRRTLLIIYAVLGVVFFGVRAWLKPYVRKLPPEITPWLHPHSQLRAPPLLDENKDRGLHPKGGDPANAPR